MKKLLVLCLSLVIAFGASLGVSAASLGGFTSSPTANQAPVVEEAKDETGAAVTIIVTPLSKKNNLSAANVATLEKAENEIRNNEDITAICKPLADVAKKADVKSENLAVSDIFDISKSDATAGGKVTLSIKADTLKNFVALLHYKNNAWEVVENAKVENGVLTFTVDSFSPFAIVVDNAAAQNSPQTGDNGISVALAIIAIVSGAALTVCVKKSKIAA